jgi:hypothetical protein
MKATNYNDDYQKVIKEHTQLKTVKKEFKPKKLGKTKIDISGKIVNVDVWRTKDGNIEIIPTNKGILEEGGWLSEGTCTEGYDTEVIITRFSHTK